MTILIHILAGILLAIAIVCLFLLTIIPPYFLGDYLRRKRVETEDKKRVERLLEEDRVFLWITFCYCSDVADEIQTFEVASTERPLRFERDGDTLKVVEPLDCFSLDWNSEYLAMLGAKDYFQVTINTVALSVSKNLEDVNRSIWSSILKTEKPIAIPQVDFEKIEFDIHNLLDSRKDLIEKEEKKELLKLSL